MARGMWSGIAQGLQQVKERERYEQERQDKLNLLNQERQDRLFSLALELAPKYAASSVLTSTTASGKNSAGKPSSAFYETQLVDFGFPKESIINLNEMGPYALELAVETFKSNYNPENPPDQSTLQKIADSIIIENVTQGSVDPVAFAERMGLNIDAFPEEERGMRQAILTSALTPAPKAPYVASTYVPTESIKPEDVTKYQTFIGETVKTVLQQNSVSVSEDQQGKYIGALRELEAGNPTVAINLLQETGQLESTLKPLFDYYPQLKNSNLPLGVFEPARQAILAPKATAVVPQQAIEYLRSNKDTPGVIEAFEQKYGVSAQEYL